jgi:putative transport protein
MIELLVENPLLLLFVVAAIGYPLGQIRIAGVHLGIGAVLFAGLAIGALHPDLKLPEFVYVLGLVLFVYTVGISSGPSFFESLRGDGLRDNAAVAAILAGSAGLVVVIAKVLDLSPAMAAGMFAGGLTNTPALAGAVDYLKSTSPRAVAEPTVAYSLAYPFGVLGVILAMVVARRILRVPAAAGSRMPAAPFQVTTVRVTKSAVCGRATAELFAAQGWRGAFGRVKRGETYFVATDHLRLEPGDLVSVVATPEHLARIVADVGEEASERIELDRSAVDFRRIFVSRREVAGRTLRELNLPERFGAVATRVRRGDVEFLATPDTVLQLGDRLRVISDRDNMAEVSRFFGDSFRALSEIDVLSFSLGICAGLFVGLVPIPLPGGVTFRLGLAAGPLIVALLLGKIGRSGTLVWALPYNVNLTLRQFGLLLFLAGIGTRSGYGFISYLATGEALPVLAGAAALTASTALAMLLVGHLLLRIPFHTLTGMLAGVHTQPAALAFALEHADDESPNLGYATVYPVATLAKVLIAQALVALL